MTPVMVWNIISHAVNLTLTLCFIITWSQRDWISISVVALEFAPLVFCLLVVATALDALMGHTFSAMADIFIASVIWSNMRRGGYW